MGKALSLPVDIEGKPFKRGGFVIVLMVGTFITIINQTLLVTALPRIMQDLGITANNAQWLITAFMLISGVMIPISAFLLNQIANRSLFFMAIGSFALGTLVCAFSTTFPTLLIGRIIQAIGTGLMIPLMQTLIFLIFPADRRGEAMGLVGIVIAFSPAIGPTLSGWIVDMYDWHYLFYLILPIVLIDIVLAFFYMKNVVHLTKPKMDILSILLSSIGLASLLYGIGVAGNIGWGNNTVLITCGIGFGVLIVFACRQFKLTEPILELSVFKDRTFTLTTVIVSIIFMTMIGSEILLPIYTQTIHGYSALRSGLILLPGALVLGIISPVAGKIFDKHGIRRISLIGLLILSLGSFPFMYLSQETSIWWIICFYSLRMAGMGLVMMPLATAGINALPKKFISHGSAANNTVRQIFASLGAAIMVGIMSTTIAKYTGDQTVTKEGNILLEATVNGLNNGFKIAFILIIIAFILSFFIKQPFTISNRVDEND
ncbi:MDR family MFS transporter [Peribacillus frigoritolerans]|uniref:MDR family MFS transporter n=1 Tax=Peribacillus frigoritolerans TaxID=450367 RepID=UPI00207A0726|nr:MDR family MFS transporter [Peribacillus frigoritolerans]USK79619.1 multidrug efflux MFS transporter [Peribacillus frigoritolerans]WJE46905.1 MDR family MFS transporter [Peribacillus frigoritolerans]